MQGVIISSFSIFFSSLHACACDGSDLALTLPAEERGDPATEMVDKFHEMFSENLQEIILVPGERAPVFRMIPHGLSRIRGGALKRVVETIEIDDPTLLWFHQRDSGYTYSCFIMRGDRGFRFEDEIVLIANKQGIFLTFGRFRGDHLYVRIKGESAEIILEAIRVRLRDSNVFLEHAIELPWSPLEGVVEIDPFGRRSRGIVDEWPPAEE